MTPTPQNVSQSPSSGAIQPDHTTADAVTPQNDELEKAIIIDPSALDFYFEAMLPEVSEQTRRSIARTMAKSITSEKKKWEALAQKEMLELIGEDEKWDVKQNYGYKQQYQNEFRAELRQAVKDHYKGGSESKDSSDNLNIGEGDVKV